MLCRRVFASLSATVLMLSVVVSLTDAVPLEMERFEEEPDRSCAVSDLFQVTVVSGKNNMGKRFYVMRIEEDLPFPESYLTSEAIGTAATAAIAAVTKPVLDSNNDNSNADSPNVDDIDDGDAETDGINDFGLERNRDGDDDSEDNFIDTDDNSDVNNEEDNPFVPIMAEENNDADTDSLERDAVQNEDGADDARNVDSGSASVADPYLLGRSDVIDASLLYVEVAVVETCDEDGNRRVVGRILSISPSAPSADTNRPVTTQSPPTLPPIEDTTFLDECPEELRDIDWRDENGNSALHLAANSSLVECVDALIDAGADLEARNNGGETPLFQTSRFGNAVSTIYLMDKGADKDAAMHGGWRPLHAAARNGQDIIVGLLLQAGVYVDTRSEDGSTPLWLAAYYNKAAVAELLVQAGADMEAESLSGITPKGIALLRGSVEVLAVFQSYVNNNNDGDIDRINEEQNENDSLERTSPISSHRFSMSNLRSEVVRRKKDPSGFVPNSLRTSGHKKTIHYPELLRRVLDD